MIEYVDETTNSYFSKIFETISLHLNGIFREQEAYYFKMNQLTEDYLQTNPSMFNCVTAIYLPIYVNLRSRKYKRFTSENEAYQSLKFIIKHFMLYLISYQESEKKKQINMEENCSVIREGAISSNIDILITLRESLIKMERKSNLASSSKEKALFVELYHVLNQLIDQKFVLQSCLDNTQNFLLIEVCLTYLLKLIFIEEAFDIVKQVLSVKEMSIIEDPNLSVDLLSILFFLSWKGFQEDFFSSMCDRLPIHMAIKLLDLKRPDIIPQTHYDAFIYDATFEFIRCDVLERVGKASPYSEVLLEKSYMCFLSHAEDNEINSLDEFKTFLQTILEQKKFNPSWVSVFLKLLSSKKINLDFQFVSNCFFRGVSTEFQEATVYAPYKAAELVSVHKDNVAEMLSLYASMVDGTDEEWKKKIKISCLLSAIYLSPSNKYLQQLKLSLADNWDEDDCCAQRLDLFIHPEEIEMPVDQKDLFLDINYLLFQMRDPGFNLLEGLTALMGRLKMHFRKSGWKLEKGNFVIIKMRTKKSSDNQSPLKISKKIDISGISCSTGISSTSIITSDSIITSPSVISNPTTTITSVEPFEGCNLSDMECGEDLSHNQLSDGGNDMSDQHLPDTSTDNLNYSDLPNIEQTEQSIDLHKSSSTDDLTTSFPLNDDMADSFFNDVIANSPLADDIASSSSNTALLSNIETSSVEITILKADTSFGSNIDSLINFSDNKCVNSFDDVANTLLHNNPAHISKAGHSETEILFGENKEVLSEPAIMRTNLSSDCMNTYLPCNAECQPQKHSHQNVKEQNDSEGEPIHNEKLNFRMIALESKDLSKAEALSNYSTASETTHASENAPSNDDKLYVKNCNVLLERILINELPDNHNHINSMAAHSDEVDKKLTVSVVKYNNALSNFDFKKSQKKRSKILIRRLDRANANVDQYLIKADVCLAPTQSNNVVDKPAKPCDSSSVEAILWHKIEAPNMVESSIDETLDSPQIKSLDSAMFVHNETELSEKFIPNESEIVERFQQCEQSPSSDVSVAVDYGEDDPEEEIKVEGVDQDDTTPPSPNNGETQVKIQVADQIIKMEVDDDDDDCCIVSVDPPPCSVIFERVKETINAAAMIAFKIATKSVAAARQPGSRQAPPRARFMSTAGPRFNSREIRNMDKLRRSIGQATMTARCNAASNFIDRRRKPFSINADVRPRNWSVSNNNCSGGGQIRTADWQAKVARPAASRIPLRPRILLPRDFKLEPRGRALGRLIADIGSPKLNRLPLPPLPSRTPMLVHHDLNTLFRSVNSGEMRLCAISSGDQLEAAKGASSRAKITIDSNFQVTTSRNSNYVTITTDSNRVTVTQDCQLSFQKNSNLPIVTDSDSNKEKRRSNSNQLNLNKDSNYISKFTDSNHVIWACKICSCDFSSHAELIEHDANFH